ncbi:MAG: hypothetical protein GXY76_14560 [Chloroflexi bacterium]|nr:hypothetical protein [Chloroflexota bacterium]
MSAVYRISKPSSRPIPVADVGGGSVARAADGAAEGFKGYLDRLMKMIPTEVISLYLVGSGLIPEAEDLTLVIWTVFCLLAVVALRAWGTADARAGLPTDWKHVGISVVAFLVWVYSLGGVFAEFGVHLPTLGSLLVLGWTFVVPQIYKGPEA